MSNVTKTIINPCQIELIVTVPYADLAAYLDKATVKLSIDLKIEGFRPGHVPYDILKQQIGELAILDEAAKELINRTAGKTVAEAIKDEDIIGQPQLSITKLAPDNDLEYKITVEILPAITLGNYQGFKITTEQAEITDEEVAKAVLQLQEAQAKETVSDKALAMGDKAIADIKMFVDSVPVDGGQAKGVAVILGKNYVVPGFDKELVGLTKEATKEFTLMYPTDHHQKNLAGKKVEFNITVKEVFDRQVPAVNDDFAVKLGLDSAEKLMAEIKANLLRQRQNKLDEKAEIALLDNLLDVNPINDLPTSLVDSEAHQMVHEMEHNIVGMGGKFDDYLAGIKKTHDDLIADFKPEAEKRIKITLLMREVARAENITADDKTIDEELKHLRQHYHDQAEALAHINQPGYRREIAGRIVNRLVIEKLKALNY